MKPPQTSELVEMEDLDPIDPTGIAPMFQYLSSPGATDKLLVPHDHPDDVMPRTFFALDNIYKAIHGKETSWEGTFAEFALKKVVEDGETKMVRDPEPLIVREIPVTKYGVPGVGAKFPGKDMPLYLAWELLKPWRHRSLDEWKRDGAACRDTFEHDRKLDEERAAWRATQKTKFEKAMRSPSEREHDMAAAISRGIAAALPAALEAMGITPQPPKEKDRDK